MEITAAATTTTTNQYNIKMLSTLFTPLFWSKEAIMTFNEHKAGIVFIFGNDEIIFPFGSFSRLPWLPPAGNTMCFEFLGSLDSNLIIEFKTHEDLLNVHALLKNKYFGNTQFISSELYHSSILEKLDNLSFEKSVIWKKIEEEKIIQKWAILSRDLSYEINRNFVWTPITKRSKQSFVFGDNKHQNMMGAEELSAKFSELSLNNIKVHQKGLPTLEPKNFGFINLGNTCYMNSILQGLFANWIFVKDLYKFCMRVEEFGWNLNEEMPLSLAVANLASRRRSTVDRLKKKLLEVIKYKTNFRNDMQQDAHEFLINILGQIQEECDKMLFKLYKIGDKQERNNRNPVISNFACIMESITKCKKCNCCTKNEEESIILSVSINMLEQAGLGSTTETSRFLSVQTLLDEYLKIEEVDKKCDICGFTEAEKQQKFARIPRCLIIFIKRYFFNASVAVKRDDKIRIPLYLTLHKTSVEEAAPFPAVSRYSKKINLNTIRPLGRKIFLNVRRRLKTRNTNNSTNLPAVDKKSIRTSNSETIALSVKLSNLTISDHTKSAIDDVRQRVEEVAEKMEMSTNSSKRNAECSETVILNKQFEGEKRSREVKTIPSKDILNSRLSKEQELKRLHLAHTENLQKRSCRRGPQVLLGYHSDEDAHFTQIKKRKAVLKRRLSDDSECDRRSETSVPKVSLLRFKEEIDAQIVGELITRQDIPNNNKGNILSRNLDHTKQKIYLKKKRSSSVSEKIKKMITSSKKSLNFEMTIIPYEYLQINHNKAFTGDEFIHYESKSMSSGTADNVRSLGSYRNAAYALQSILYKPLSKVKRREICMLIGLFPRKNWIINSSSVYWMSVYDRPDFLVVVPGSDNRLFQALAHYITGDSNDFRQVRQAIIQFELEHSAEFMNLKQWDKFAWEAHLNNLSLNCENGSDVELFAFALMFKIDVWIFRRKRWFCYGPKFTETKDQCRNISIQQCDTGENEGVYLNYENGLFFPVFKPSDKWFNTKISCNSVFNNVGVTIQPSYRLISVVSHLGQTIDKGHYVCDIWCNESRKWYLCDDESVQQIDEMSVQKKSTTGYTYFYLNRELFKGE